LKSLRLKPLLRRANVPPDARPRLVQRKQPLQNLVVAQRPDERAVATMLDSSPLVRWWHRNPSDHRKREAVGLYRWHDGDGFYPDFVVSLSERQSAGGIALLEVSGNQWWGDPHEVDKAEAQHADYGPVFMIGRDRGQRDFMHLRKLDGRLRTDGAFSVDRLRW